MTNTQRHHSAQSTADYDRSSQDVGNVLGLEHVNLAIIDRDLAERFYVSGLGFTRDPYVDLGLFGATWVNLGSQQMHLVLAAEAQRFRGSIGLVVPDPAAVVKRLDRLVDRIPLVAQSQVAHHQVDGQLIVTGPWGNTFRLHGPDEIAGISIGVAYVEIDVAPGCSAGVAAFYTTVMGCPAVVEENDTTKAVITVGRHQQMRFRETEEAIPAYDGHHVAVYLNNFSQPYDFLLGRGLITRETNEHEYRFCDIVDPASGQVCAVLEHEVRSMYHPMFGRDLINRRVSEGQGLGYRQGHEAQPGLHQSGLG